jgi:hypothetical protein
MSDKNLTWECKNLARKVLWNNCALSNDVIDTLADKFLKIADDHSDYVTSNYGNDELLSHIVRYLSEVHAVPTMGTDTKWFQEAFRVLLELACPNSGVTEEGSALFSFIQDGIRSSLAEVPVHRNLLKLEDVDVQSLKYFEEAGVQFGIVSSLLDVVERHFHGGKLTPHDQALFRIAAIAAPLTRHARATSE